MPDGTSGERQKAARCGRAAGQNEARDETICGIAEEEKKGGVKPSERKKTALQGSLVGAMSVKEMTHHPGKVIGTERRETQTLDTSSHQKVSALLSKAIDRTTECRQGQEALTSAMEETDPLTISKGES